MDYETINGVETSYSSDTGLKILSAPEGVPLRTFLAAVIDFWPVKVPQDILDRPENRGLPVETVTAIQPFFHTEDYDLTAEDLDHKYNPEGDGGHPHYTRKYWRDVVADRNTLQGYWEWVKYALEVEEDEGHIRAF
jgi:hypothetical protein